MMLPQVPGRTSAVVNGLCAGQRMANRAANDRRVAGWAQKLTLVLALSGLASAGLAAEEPAAAGRTGLALPRFVSLKSDRVNLRQGPGSDYRIVWVFRRAGLPIEVVKESESWRQVRDSEGATGWVLASMLSGRRTVTVSPWEAGKPAASVPANSGASLVPLFASEWSGSGVVANVEPGVIASVLSCSGTWCRISLGELKGFIEQKKLWGVYEGETVK